MAKEIMHHLVVGDNSFEIVDNGARERLDGHDTAIAVERARIDELVNEGNVDLTAVTLFEGTARYKNTTYQLAQSVTGFDFLDFYITVTAYGSNYLKTIPIEEDVVYSLQAFNLPNTPALAFNDTEFSVKVVENVLTIVSHNFFLYSNNASQSQAEIVTANSSDFVKSGGGYIYKIVGRKAAENAEVADARTDIHGVTYPTLGGYIREVERKQETGWTGWTGLKWACMGDSVTDANNDWATKRYHDYISDATGISVINLGKGGTGYKNQYGDDLPFYQRVDTIPLDSDVITIFGSGNDRNLTLGTPTDTTDATVCGCVNLTIDGIRSRITGANIGIITPIPWGEFPPATQGNKMDLYANALVEICKLKGVPCLDLYHSSNMLPWVEAFRNAYYSRANDTGIHPDENGHKLFAPRIKAFLGTLLM